MSGPQRISRSTEKHHALLLRAPSPWKADGHHCTVERYPAKAFRMPFHAFTRDRR